MFLIIMGIFAKFAASLVAIPASVLGGMTTFLFCSVAVSGIAIITKGVPFNRRNRFILTAGLAIGYGATLVPNYFSRVFSYSGDNKGLQGFLDAISLIMSTGFAVTALICMVLNLTLPAEIEETAEEVVPATTTTIHKKNSDAAPNGSGSLDSDDIRPVEEGRKVE